MLYRVIYAPGFAQICFIPDQELKIHLVEVNGFVIDKLVYGVSGMLINKRISDFSELRLFIDYFVEEFRNGYLFLRTKQLFLKFFKVFSRYG